MTGASDLDIKSIQYASYFKRLRTSAEFAGAIDDLTRKQLDAQKRRADLMVAEDAARFGDGDLAKVQADLKACDAEIEDLEKQLEGCRRRRQEASQNERLTEIEHVGRDAKAKASALEARLHRSYELIEALRGELFEADALTIAITAANNTLEGAGRNDLRVNVTAVRRTAMGGPRATPPARISRKGLMADKMLLSFLTTGGVLDRRTAVIAATGEAAEIKGAAHHAAFYGGDD